MKRLLLALCISTLQPAAAQFLACDNPRGQAPGGVLNITDGAGPNDSYNGHLAFQYSGTFDFYGNPVADADNLVLLAGSQGTTSAVIQTAVNSAALLQHPPGALVIFSIKFSTVGVTPASSVGCQLTSNIPPEPAPFIQAVVNAASLQPPLSPGAMVSILGTHLTGPTQSTAYGPTASYPTTVAGTTVTFNGTPAPLLYVSPTQINAIVPFALAGQTSAQVMVQRFTVPSATFGVAIQVTSPAIFTASQTGSGQAAVLQQGPDGSFTYNSSANPATAGTALEIFATGAGVWTPAAQADLSLFGAYFTTLPVSVTVGGQPAQVLYAGTIGTDLASYSVLQVNAIVPNGLASGTQPVVLKIGASDNSQQKVTISVQ